MRMSRTTLATLVAGGLLAVGVAGAGALTASGALAADPAPTGPGSSQAPEGGYGPGRGGTEDGRRGDGPGRGGHGFGHRGPLAGLGRALHGEVVVQKADGSGTETLLLQRGTVTASSSGSLTVRSTDGFTATWTLAEDTVVRAGRTGTTAQDLAVGDEVVVTGLRTAADRGTARFVLERPTKAPDGAAPDRSNRGSDPTPDGGPSTPPTQGSSTTT